MVKVMGLWGLGSDAPKSVPVAWKRARKARATKAGAVTIMRPDADGHLRLTGEPVRTVKRVRWDAAGLYVQPRPTEV